MSDPKTAPWRPGVPPCGEPNSRKLTLAAILFFMASSVSATWKGALNLNSDFAPVMIRELHDGQWLAGVAKTDIWHLDQDGVQRFHAGLFQAWNAERGNPTFGTVVGVDLPVGLATSIAAALPDWFKPSTYIASAVSLDFFGGYRPQHSDDTHSWVYGIGAKLKVSFGQKELQKGL